MLTHFFESLITFNRITKMTFSQTNLIKHSRRKHEGYLLLPMGYGSASVETRIKRIAIPLREISSFSSEEGKKLSLILVVSVQLYQNHSTADVVLWLAGRCRNPLNPLPSSSHTARFPFDSDRVFLRTGHVLASRRFPAVHTGRLILN